MNEMSPEMRAESKERMGAYNEERMRELDVLIAAGRAAVRAQEINITPEERAEIGGTGQ